MQGRRTAGNGRRPGSVSGTGKRRVGVAGVHLGDGAASAAMTANGRTGSGTVDAVGASLRPEVRTAAAPDSAGRRLRTASSMSSRSAVSPNFLGFLSVRYLEYCRSVIPADAG